MEEEQEQTASHEFLSGFNAAYVITQYMPELAGKLAAAVPADERGQGFKAGHEEMMLERTLDYLQSREHERDVEGHDREKSFDGDLDLDQDLER